ncbi:imm11 family protein [Vibrio jasicida]|uniref:imm11 family protein n=1 Tax=Vibrio jasicida TaxID=766224 RepID=UPI00406896F8
MNYYHMEWKFIEDEASFSTEEAWYRVHNNYYPNIKAYTTPIKVSVDEVYEQRQMSDMLKAIDFLPHKKVVQQLLSQQISGIQLLPTEVDVDGTIYNGYWFMNVFARYPVLNISESRAKRFDDDYDAYTFLIKTVLDKEKLSKIRIKHDIFRCSECPAHIIANERVKQLFESNGFTGVAFNEVKVV